MNEIVKRECPETSSTLILYLYDEIASPAEFEKHLAVCEDCANALESHKRALTAYRNELITLPRAIPVLVAPSFMDRLRDFFAAPTLRPVYAAAVVAMVVGAFVAGNNISSDRVLGPGNATAFSYSKMDVALEGVEEEIEFLIAANDDVFDTAARENQVDVMSRELDDISENLREF